MKVFEIVISLIPDTNMAIKSVANQVVQKYR